MDAVVVDISDGCNVAVLDIVEVGLLVASPFRQRIPAVFLKIGHVFGEGRTPSCRPMLTVPLKRNHVL
jgi:hypothetical protein